jgi:hypothetical protein
MRKVLHQPGGMASAKLLALMVENNRLIYAWPVLLIKAARTFLSTRSWITIMFAWQSKTAMLLNKLASSSAYGS